MTFATTFATTTTTTTTTEPSKATTSSKQQQQQLQLQQALAELEQRTIQMNDRAAQGLPLTEDELQGILHSIQNVNPADNAIDYIALKALLKQVAHVSHKDWTVTEANAKKLGEILLPPKNGGGGGMSTTAAHQMLERIVTEGNWDAAAQHAARCTNTSTTTEKPFAVLVTGVNGIRKTSAMYQPWFADLLQEALVVPTTITTESSSSFPSSFATSDLPTGHNSFFRQLDHMIATLVNTEFATLYRLTSQIMLHDNNNNNNNKNNKKTADETNNTTIAPAVVQAYSNYKAALFTRYRTVSELLGANLLQQAQLLHSNCLMETSGRDVAMFHYVDHFFPSSSSDDDDDDDATNQYHKLALHFQINDLRYAQTSVDQRMKDEIVAGIQAIQTGDAFDVIQANAGGPYGSEVLPDVQESSDCVWNDIILKKDSTVGHDWYKATILINARDTEPWTAQAVKPDGSLGTEYVFGPKRSS